MSYLVLTFLLLTFGFTYLYAYSYRLVIAIIIGLVYFFWGIWHHWHEHTLHQAVVLEYFGFSLLAVTILIFISLRAA
jgi:hypothetical protein